ncbi:MAG: CDP-alcohol phosphatidyltransferase family protein [Muribaculaceae bacterium]|nr:CDP-alcohol phosphatidyltransferase family protein [Muribaculaceae bacterium]
MKFSKEEFESTLKSPDTEEHIDLYFYRRLGYFFACIGRELHISPNAITIASIFIGVAAGICFYPTNIWVNVCGMLLLILADAFDSADGQLARMTKQYSRLGRILDGMAGDFWFIAIYVCICLRVNATSDFFSEHTWIVWTMAVAAGFCHATQASMADYYRQMHLLCVNGKSELDSASILREKFDQSRREGVGFINLLIQWFYLNYTTGQEGRTPQMQKMRAALLRKYPDGEIPQGIRDQFRALSLPLMKYTNILSFNWRSITLFISLFLQMPWLYFAAELTIFNGIMAYMMWRHETICKQITYELEND